MIDPTDADARFDRAARARYQAGLDAIAPRTLARLRPKPEPTPRGIPRPWGWSLAGAGAAVLALAVGIGIGTQPPAEPSAPATAARQLPVAAAPAVDGDAYQDAVAAFEEDPEMFLWLASAEAAPLAME